MSTTDKNRNLSLVGEPTARLPERIDRPSYAVYDEPTTVDGRHCKAGTWYHGLKQTGADEKATPVDHWICAPLHVEGETVSTEDGSIGRLLSFTHRWRRIEWVMPMEALAGKGDEVLKVLMSKGLVIEHSQRRHIVPYLASHHLPDVVMSTTSKPGWHESGAFVLPSKVIGGENVRFQDSGKAANIFTVKGSPYDWQTHVAKRCTGNPVLILSVCCALAGPLLAKVGVNGGGVHLVGDSSSGKSLAQLIAASVWGDPGTFAASWDVSKGGVEIEASSRNDTVLILDEIKRADPKRVQEMAYAIANGMGKGTMTRDREGRSKLTWRVLALSSGERSLSDHAASIGNDTHAGAELRMVDVNAGTRTHRAFDDVHGMSGQEFHRVLTEAVGRNFGHTGPLFVESLIQSPEDWYEAFCKVRGEFATESSQAGRVADRFAIMALAGELAINREFLPWEKGSATKACRQLFHEWVATAGDGSAEDRQILHGIRTFLERYGDSRFSDFASQYGHTSVSDRAGYFEMEEEKRLYYLNDSGIKQAASGFSIDRIIRALVSVDALAKVDIEKGKNRHQKSHRLPGGGRGRFYCIDIEKLI